jgi:hypothetical protein
MGDAPLALYQGYVSVHHRESVSLRQFVETLDDRSRQLAPSSEIVHYRTKREQ